MLRSRKAWLLALDRAAAACAQRSAYIAATQHALPAAIAAEQPPLTAANTQQCSQMHSTHPFHSLTSPSSCAHAPQQQTHIAQQHSQAPQQHALHASRRFLQCHMPRRFLHSSNVLAAGWSDEEDDAEAKEAAEAAAQRQYAQEDYSYSVELPETIDDVPEYMSLAALDNATEADVGKYMLFDEFLIPPEATQEWHIDPVILKEKDIIPFRAGCRGLQDEFEMSGELFLMFRQSTYDLIGLVESQKRPLIKVDGTLGCGKSIALVMLTAWARANKYIVLYVPSAFTMLFNSDFMVSPEGICDTPETAKQLLKSIHGAHAEYLKELNGPQSIKLLSTIEAALESQEPHEPVDALIDVLEQLRDFTEAKVLVAIDDYNTLWLNSEYMRFVPGSKNDHFVEAVPGRDVRAAAALRLLNSRPPVNGAFVCALSKSERVSPKLKIPKKQSLKVVETHPETDKPVTKWTSIYTKMEGGSAAPNRVAFVQIPPFSLQEMTTMAAYYSYVGTGFVGEHETDEELAERFLEAYHLSQGNPRMFRNELMWGTY